MTEQEWIDKVRANIRDYPQFNILGNSQVEFTDDEIKEALSRAIDRVNLCSPYSNWQLESLPPLLNEPTLMYTIAHLLQMRIREYSRNNIDYQSGGTGVTFNTIIAEYAQAASILEEKAEVLASRLKTQWNIENGFEVIDSPHGYYAWW